MIELTFPAVLWAVLRAPAPATPVVGPQKESVAATDGTYDELNEEYELARKTWKRDVREAEDAKARRERRQAFAELIVGALAGGRPAVSVHTQRIVDEAKTPYRRRRGQSFGPHGRNHGVQQRQRQHGARAAKKRASRKILLRDEHGSLL